jgi:hypothetical protein
MERGLKSALRGDDLGSDIKSKFETLLIVDKPLTHAVVETSAVKISFIGFIIGQVSVNTR